MQEKISPNDALKLRASIGSITRLNPKMVLVLLAGLAVAVAVAFSVGLRVSKRQAVDAEKQAKLRHGNPPESLSFLPKTYADIQPPAVAPLEPTLPVLPELEDFKVVDEEEEKARTSGIFFNGPNQRQTPHGVQTGPGNGGVFTHQSATTQNGGSGSNRLENLRSNSGLEPYLKHPYTKPLSRYELKAGSVIPAALLTAINTDLPGDIVARVTEHVYDSATGRFLLVPQGATLYGAYDSLIANGQNRALVVWQRLIMPDGRSILLDGMAGVDKAGNGGLSDRVDYHFGKLATGILLSTAITFGGNLARGDVRSLDYGDIVGDTVAQEASRVGQRIVDRQLGIQPTITIRAGWPLRVLVNKDMGLEPYNR